MLVAALRFAWIFGIPIAVVIAINGIISVSLLTATLLVKTHPVDWRELALCVTSLCVEAKCSVIRPNLRRRDDQKRRLAIGHSHSKWTAALNICRCSVACGDNLAIFQRVTLPDLIRDTIRRIVRIKSIA